MTELSKFFFLPLQYDNAESMSLVKTLNGQRYGTSMPFLPCLATTQVLAFAEPKLTRTVSVLEEVIAEIEARIEDEGHGTEIDIDLAWRAIHAVVRRMELKKSELLTPMRHALTARQVSPDFNLLLCTRCGGERISLRGRHGVAC
jgi:hypothetical protein